MNNPERPQLAAICAGRIFRTRRKALQIPPVCQGRKSAAGPASRLNAPHFTHRPVSSRCDVSAELSPGSCDQAPQRGVGGFQPTARPAWPADVPGVGGVPVRVCPAPGDGPGEPLGPWHGRFPAELFARLGDLRAAHASSTEVPPEAGLPSRRAGPPQVHHRYNSRCIRQRGPAGVIRLPGAGLEVSAAHKSMLTTDSTPPKSQSKRSGEPLLQPRFRPLYVRNQCGAATSGD